jgi:outer membrane biosynthesis protein TonB
MFKFDKTDLQRFAVSSVGALALSAACIGAAVAPAKAATAPLTAADWQESVARKVDNVRERGAVTNPSKLTKAEVSVHFTADGDFAGATMARSTGSRELDKRAIKVAHMVDYPALPAGYRGAPRTVRMNLYFGNTDHGPQYETIKARADRQLQVAGNDIGSKTQVAAR